MVQKMYTIFDKLAKDCGQIELCKNDAVASRMFKNTMKSNPSADPNDYQLYCLGTIDTETMLILVNVDAVALDDGEVDV